MKVLSAGILSQVLLLAAIPVHAADLQSQQSPKEVRFSNSDFYFLGGVGYTSLRGDEFVYRENGNKLSHLIWKSDAPVLTATAKAIFDNDWTLSGNLVVGMTGNSKMADYDWVEKPTAGFAADAWSHESLHPDTTLDRYWTADIAVGHNFNISETTILNLHGGFKYTNVKWSAYGGSYIYSSEGSFRDETGNFPDGERGITYEQTYPAAFLGLEATKVIEQWSFSALARGGLSFTSKDEDHHWSRKILFKEEFKNTPFISLGARAEYAVTQQATFFLAGNFERYFNKVGDMKIYDIVSGEKLESLSDAAGMKFQSWSVTGGFKYRF